MYAFPQATEDLLIILNENKDDPAQAIDAYLKKFSVQCAQSFMDSIQASRLFTDDELLDRMKERLQ